MKNKNKNHYNSFVANQLYNQSLEYLNGSGVVKDEQKSFRLNVEAAEFGMADALLAMGWYYLNGVGVEADLEKAIHWYKLSARKHEPRAFFSLGEIEYDQRNYDAALRWFDKAIKKKHYKSLYWKAKFYYWGLAVEKNRELAETLIQEAAAKKVESATRYFRWKNKIKKSCG